MAAVSHLKNAKDAKTREGIDRVRLVMIIKFDRPLQMMQISGTSGGEPVCIKKFMEVLGSCHIQLEPKEVARLERITQEDSTIERDQFIEFAKRFTRYNTFVMYSCKRGHYYCMWKTHWQRANRQR